ncbi:metal-sensitive transcriptional regulator [Agromyces sp. Soil535]|uniref:metal-sensitive transcriptional regulator n=1 Tax=Agromyces sp. Soil535 TaxID=1736390 RepID=UPI0006F290CF|nr:metal-sensitive transcriptional regulator [Agromyces sp. Soil535]KRE21250.1 transcriptional regulator [Agromyces sp. Soil535]
MSAAAAAASAGADRRVLNRLKRARGQLNAVIEAVESGGDCRTVVTQLAAVSSALDKAGFAIISGAMRDCLAEPAATSAEASGQRGTPRERLSIDELEKLFLTLS